MGTQMRGRMGVIRWLLMPWDELRFLKRGEGETWSFKKATKKKNY